MGLPFAPLGPTVSRVVMIDTAQQQTGIGFMYDQPDVFADPYRPEIFIPCLVQFVKAHAGTGRIELQIKGGGFDRFLLVAGEFGKAVGEGVGYAEVHKSLFIAT